MSGVRVVIRHGRFGNRRLRIALIQALAQHTTEIQRQTWIGFLDTANQGRIGQRGIEFRRQFSRDEKAKGCTQAKDVFRNAFTRSESRQVFRHCKSIIVGLRPRAQSDQSDDPVLVQQK